MNLDVLKNKYFIIFIITVIICLTLFYIFFYNHTLVVINSMIKIKEKKPPLIIVFDLDETLGSFLQLGHFCHVLEKHHKSELDKEEFFKILDENQEYIRPRIYDLLKLTLEMKNQKVVDGIMIYTNNQGPNRWANSISDYFSYKLNQPVFDNIIRAFKIDGRIIEPNRTSHDKSYSDLLRCTKLPKNTMVYFIDDVEHPKMVHNNVYYVNVRPYKYHQPMLKLLNKYNNIKNLTSEELTELWNKIHQYTPEELIYSPEKSEEEQNVDNLTGKFLISQMSDFLSEYKDKYSHNKSLKKYSNKLKKNKTLKSYKQ